MAIYRLLQYAAFGPEEIGIITSAYEDALVILKIADRSDPITETLAKKIIDVAQTGERNCARIRALALKNLGVSHLIVASGISDLDQSAKLAPSDNLGMEWRPIATAPFDGDLELAVIDFDGTHALVFPCRRMLHGWISAETKKRLDDLRPTHWREWRVST